jgi:hypothetical protein
VALVPGRYEPPAASANDQQLSTRLQRLRTPPHGWIRDGDCPAGTGANRLSVQFERRSPFQNQVQLLLAAFALVVFSDQRLAGTGCDKEVYAKRVESYVIEPGHEAWAVGDEPVVAYEFESKSAEEYARE